MAEALDQKICFCNMQELENKQIKKASPQTNKQ